MSAVVEDGALAVRGEVAPGFEIVRDVLAANIADLGDGGCSYAAYVEGRRVVDLWVGDAGADAWQEDTLALWMSVTKAMTALCVQLLADRGRLDVEAPVARYWPEFGTAGKDEITVSDVLTHQSGVVGSAALTTIINAGDGAGIDRTDDIVAALAAAEPLWTPRLAVGYQTASYGWLLGEVVRRVDGRDLGTFFREEVALPLGLTDLWIGTPEQHHDRIATVHHTMWPETMPPEFRAYMERMLGAARDETTVAGVSCFARGGVGILDRLPEVFNHPHGRTPPLGASNLCGAARDVARVFAAIVEPGGLDGVRLVSPESVERFTTIRETREDLVLLLPVARALGYWRNRPLVPRPRGFGPNDEAFGHTGVGGQMGFADPSARVGAAFVRNHYTAFPMLPLLLNGALYQAIAG